VILLAALIGLFAKSVIDNQTSIAADVADGGHPMAPNFTLQNVNGQAPPRSRRCAASRSC